MSKQEARPALPEATSLLTDHYELTMADAAIQEGTADRECMFELFARKLPNDRRHWPRPRAAAALSL